MADPGKLFWKATAWNQTFAAPTAGIAGPLYQLGADHPWLDKASAYCWNVIETAKITKPHDFLCIVRFLEHVPDRERAHRGFQWIAVLMEQAGVIETDPHAQGYVKMPLDWAPTPDSLCRQLFSDELIATHLDALARRQTDDGGWPPTWTPISPANEQEWRGHVTVEALLTLKAYGYLHTT